MKQRMGPVIVCMMLVALVLACGGLLPEPAPTLAPPTAVVIPRATTTPVPSPMPTPTTFVPLPPPPLQEFVSQEGGYSVDVPPGWMSVDLEGVGFLSNNRDTLDAFNEGSVELPAGSVMIFILPVTAEEWEREYLDLSPGSITMEDLLTLDTFSPGVSLASEPEALTVSGSPAVAFEITMDDEPTFGTADGYMMLIQRADGMGGLAFVGLSQPQDWAEGFRGDVITLAETIRLLPLGTEAGQMLGETDVGADLIMLEGNVIESPGEPPDGFLWQVQRPLGEEPGDFSGLLDIVYYPDGFLVVSDDHFGLWVVDATNGDVLGNIPLGEGIDMPWPAALALSPDMSTLFISDTFSGSILTMDTETGDLLGSFGEGAFEIFSPQTLAAASDALYATNFLEDDGRYELLKFALDGTLLWRVDLTALAGVDDRFTIAVAPDDSVYVVLFTSGDFIHIGSDGSFIAATPSAFPYASSLEIAPDGTFYVASALGLSMSNAAGEELVSYGIALEEGPFPNGGYLLPAGITIGPSGVIYYVDYDLNSNYSIIGAFSFP